MLNCSLQQRHTLAWRRQKCMYACVCYVSENECVRSGLCRVLCTATKGKGSTAGLKPRSPQDLLPGQLARGWVRCMCVCRWRRVCDGSAVMLNCFGGLFQDLSVARFAGWSQGTCLWGVGVEVKQERGVMVGHVISMTETHLGVIAATGTRDRKSVV